MYSKFLPSASMINILSQQFTISYTVNRKFISLKLISWCIELMPYCWCPLVTYKDEKLSRANVHVMGKFVTFILISIVYFGLVQRLNIKRNVIPPSLFISLHLLISRLRDLKCSRKSSACSDWIKSHFDTDAKQWKSQRKNVLILRFRVGGSTLVFMFFSFIPLYPKYSYRWTKLSL